MEIILKKYSKEYSSLSEKIFNKLTNINKL